MNGSDGAAFMARIRGISGIRLHSVDTVIATVAASAVVSAFCSFVVVSNVYDALHGPRPAVTETARAEPAPAPARRHPVAETAHGIAALSRFDDPALSARTPAVPGEVELVARLPQIYRPPAAAPAPVAPLPALALRAPLARPESLAAGIAARAIATPEEAPVNPLLVAVSPRPSARPADLVARVSTRAPTVAAAIEVARAEAPGAALPPISDEPARLFPPRAGANPCGPRLADAIPRRPRDAAEGSALMARLGNGSGSGRDDAIVAEAVRGNLPEHLRALQPVRFTGDVGGRQTEIVLCVTPDYLAVGSDRDHVRVPLGLPAALRVADAFDMMLPTTRMVDAIYAQADLRLSPRPMTPGPQMSSTDYFLRHDATLDAQFADAGGRNGLLVAGHKKDLVIANRLSSNRGRVAIYGWHRGNGDPIQPLSTVHGEYYADYSHGIRLVSRTAYVNGRPVDLRTLLTDGAYAGLLNSEGPLSSATIRLASL
ncbi:hypothetical protein [Roseicyclus sp.]|uniref:hypothetical protein n=1 Tax=Roseicyclus sp. TaxID=1914329 RepID=UPI003F9F9215